MFKIGIIGGECSHAEYFAYYYNKLNDKGEYNCPGYKVTAISGMYKQDNIAIAEKFNVEKVYDKPKDMLGLVDGVMITSRDGKFHYEQVLPFIEKGIPTFIDKPITTNYEEAKKLIEVAKKNNTLLIGGSVLKYSKNVLDFKKIVEDNRSLVFGGQISTPVFTNCEYSGFWFYASHLVEVCVSIFGKNIKSIYSSLRGENVSVIFDYDTFSVVGQYANDCPNSYQMTLILKDKNILSEVDDGICIDIGCKKYIEMIESKKMEESYEDLIYPVFLIERIIQSYTSGKKIIL